MAKNRRLRQLLGRGTRLVCCVGHANHVGRPHWLPTFSRFVAPNGWLNFVANNITESSGRPAESHRRLSRSRAVSRAFLKRLRLLLGLVAQPGNDIRAKHAQILSSHSFESQLDSCRAQAQTNGGPSTTMSRQISRHSWPPALWAVEATSLANSLLDRNKLSALWLDDWLARCWASADFAGRRLKSESSLDSFAPIDCARSCQARKASFHQISLSARPPACLIGCLSLR